MSSSNFSRYRKIKCTHVGMFLMDFNKTIQFSIIDDGIRCVVRSCARVGGITCGHNNMHC